MKLAPQQRQAILELLYDLRLTEGSQPLFCTPAELTDALGPAQFNLGVLEELGFIQRDDGHRYRITGQGVIQAERFDESMGE